jgi:outer membrane protein assembly factor BamB
VHGDLLLFATRGGQRVVALDKHSGREIWSFTGHPSISIGHDRITLHNGVLFVVVWDGARYHDGDAETAQTWVHALNATTGEELWVTRLTDAWPSLPTVTARHVLLMTSPRNPDQVTRLRALDRSTGRQIWIHEGQTGANYWKSTSMVNRSRPPLVSGERVALFASDLYVAGIDVDSGREMWRLSEPFAKKFLNQYHLGPTVVVITGDVSALTMGEFIGIDVISGQVKWRRDMPSRDRVEVTIDGSVFVRSSLLGRTLMEIDGRTGEDRGTVWRAPLVGNAYYSICAGPLRFGDLLLLSTTRGGDRERGYLYAIRGGGKNRR